MAFMIYSTEKHLSFGRLHDIVHGICSTIERAVPSDAITVIGGRTSRHLYVDIMQGKTVMFSSSHETITMEVIGVDVVHRGIEQVIRGHITLEEYQWLYDEIELRFKVMLRGDVTDNTYKVKDITSIDYYDVSTCNHLYASVGVTVSGQLSYFYCFHK